LNFFFFFFFKKNEKKYVEEEVEDNINKKKNIPKTVLIISIISMLRIRRKLIIACLCLNERAKCQRKKEVEISWALPYEKREMESGEAHAHVKIHI